ncbi:hypothetical protein RRG08_040665 [Elysia crispata]|uniref:Uncharacterized protein n=1 Tax=Elysia crispata TaxID=231223 RepID=A0AAE0YYQ8_9GAST|nr:hypothetical protein RRG08_040665 [Elysia crispata]
MDIVLVLAVGERAEASTGTGRQEKLLMPQAAPAEQKLEQDLFHQGKTTSTVQLTGDLRPGETRGNAGHSVDSKVRTSEAVGPVKLGYVDEAGTGVTRHQPLATGEGKSKPESSHDHGEERSPEIQFQTLWPSYITLSSKVSKNSLQPTSSEGGPAFKRSALRRSSRLRGLKINRCRQEIKSEETVSSDQDLFLKLVSHATFSNLTFGRGTDGSHAWDLLDFAKSVNNGRYLLPHDLERRATVSGNSTKSCRVCTVSNTYQRFRDTSCSGAGSHCPWCNCPNTSPCDPSAGPCQRQCAYGWEGADCWRSVCPNRMFAPYRNCSFPCENQCSHQGIVCHPISGECVPVANAANFSVCPRKTFGRYCNRHCHCWGGRVCNPEIGACPEGVCHSAYMGLICDIPGSQFHRRSLVLKMVSLLAFLWCFKLGVRVYNSNYFHSVSGQEENSPLT